MTDKGSLELVEKVARAMCAAEGYDAFNAPVSDAMPTEYDRRIWLRRAQAALAATPLVKLREALRPFAAASRLFTSGVHNGGLENVQEFPTPDEWRRLQAFFPEFDGPCRKTKSELRAALSSNLGDYALAPFGLSHVSLSQGFARLPLSQGEIEP